jgi:hypothetical protein
MNIFTEIQKKNTDPDTYTQFIISSLQYAHDNRIKSNINDPIKVLSKHRILKEYQDNVFIPSESKRKMLIDFCVAQRTYFAFSRLAQIYKFRNTKNTISIDLYLNEISKEHRNAICIHANATNYWFMIGDLCNHIFAALTNSPYYFADPLPIKNPYTNIPFTNAELYAIYFKVRTSTFILPILFHKFFLCNFDLIKFRLDNEAEIRESFIRRHIHATEEPILYAEILLMLFHNRRRNRFIHPTIPKPEFIKIMRPYLYLFIVSEYHVGGLEKVTIAKVVLRDRLKELFQFNPRFGRIYIKRKGKTSYDLEHPKFGLDDAITSLSL